ncbi:MAG: bifunctional 4-hydroxy-2-oxoglutarate aldolase/2-dehydro-3-deoxy-phosphogluconate aldolase [Clostridia bacterium]|nr:bifunctional 4-hydroxy-2-oxoglutarate aldolase/2-dehydro-3-deoxy-phosphogluconate aldolase [Clostridia bacterium]
MEAVKQRILDSKIIAIVRGIDSDKILPTCKALYEGGVDCIEVTFNQSSETCIDDTARAIKNIADNMPEICVGAGTVMTVEQTEAAVKAGAKYIISPNFDEEVVKKTLELGVLSIPGVLTPTEITNAYQKGAAFAKVFPAGNFGLGYIKAIRSPVSHIPMLAVGGVDADNVKDFMAAGIQGVGVGSSLVNKKLINEGRFDEITALAKRFVENVK